MTTASASTPAPPPTPRTIQRVLEEPFLGRSSQSSSSSSSSRGRRCGLAAALGGPALGLAPPAAAGPLEAGRGAGPPAPLPVRMAPDEPGSFFAGRAAGTSTRWPHSGHSTRFPAWLLG